MTSDFSALLRQTTRLTPGIALLTAVVMAGGCGVKFQAGDRIDLDGDGFFAMADPGSYAADTAVEPDARRQQLLFLQLDCNDGNDDINPNASELCDGLDNDCDGERDRSEQDQDGDGFTPCGVHPDGTDLIGADCNDTPPLPTFDPASEASRLALVAPYQNPSRVEYCGFPKPTAELFSGEWPRSGAIPPEAAVSVRPTLGIDDNCDGELMPGEVDADGDGHFRGCEAALLDDSTTPPAADNLLEVDCVDSVEIAGLEDLAVQIHPGVDDLLATCTEFKNEDLLRVDSQCDPEETPNAPDNDSFADDGINWYADRDDDKDGDPGDIQNLCLGGAPGEGRINESEALGIEDCNDQNSRLHSLDLDEDDWSSCGPNYPNELGDFLNGQSYDGDDSVFPEAPELCDRKDNDLDGSVDEDFDQDGDGSFDETVTACDIEYGVAADCDDTDPLLNGNDVDNDGSSTCAGDCDDGNPGISLTDADQDGWFTCPTIANGGLVDCNDSDPALNQDNFDGDAFTSCEGDCDESTGAGSTGALVGPEQTTECDGIDDTNCDGVFDPLEVDNDGDGAPECPDTTNNIPGDCNDADPALNVLNEDGDPYTTCDGDCDDDPATGATTYPGAPALCDGIVDNDCNGAEDANEADLDQDGFVLCAVTSGTTFVGGDCDDSDAALTPVDGDGDGDSTCTGDCDDNNAAAGPNVDADGDGWTLCPLGAQPADCDDNDATLNQSDSDQDGDASCPAATGDCDDLDPTVNTLDVDGDGVDSCDGDCNDLVAAVRPNGGPQGNVAETLNGIDDNCSGMTDEGNFLSRGDIVIVEMMISGLGPIADGAAEYIEVVNTRTDFDVDLRGVVVEITNTVPDPSNPGQFIDDVLADFAFDSDPLGMPLTVVAGGTDRVAIGRSAAIDGANLNQSNGSATYLLSGTRYSWQAGLLSDLGGTITLKHGTVTLDEVTWYASGWVAGTSSYDLDQDNDNTADRSRWRPGFSMGLPSLTDAVNENDDPESWCQEVSGTAIAVVGTAEMYGSPAAAQATSGQVCN